MALTKITGQVINNTTGLVVGVTTVGGGVSATDGFFSGIVTAVGDASFSGNVSVGGTLTYEDVTNIDAVGLVTARNGIVVGSGITLSKDGDVFFTGVSTGNGSGLTALNATQLTSGTIPDARFPATLPAVSGANLTGIAATDNVRTGILDVAGISTFRNTVNIGAAVTISESGIEASGIGITVANINGTQIGGRRNMIINGDMTVAQRGTPTAAASYTSGGYAACDRWRFRAISTDEADFVVSQESDAPTASGFTKSLKIKTNTVESALASDEIFHVSQRIEAQDLQHLKYGTSSALPTTLSFWVKAYQTGTYAINVYKPDSPNRQITATYTISASNTWEFKTMTFPGDTAGGGITDDTGTGLQIYWLLATGTDYTGTTSTSWDNYANGGFANGQAVNIMSSTDNYFYLTGVQFEVGSQATAFEHRSFGEELALCQRYFYMHAFGSGVASPDSSPMGVATQYSITSFFGPIQYPVRMRAHPSFYKSLGTDRLLFFGSASSQGFNDVASQDFGVNASIVNYYDSLNSSAAAGWVQLENTYTGSYVGFDAEL